jgi:hypothetical protein
VRYVDVQWHHPFEDEPVRLIHEVDDDGYETRKVEFIADGSTSYADGTRLTGDSVLSEGRIPSDDEIGADPQFSVHSISAVEFELAWTLATVASDRI